MDISKGLTTPPYTPHKIYASREAVSRAIIDDFMRVHEIHLLAGPSGSGKSTWSTMMLQRWYKGESVFGHKSHPAPFAYITCDRSEESALCLLYQVGIDPNKEFFPLYSALEEKIPKSLDVIIPRVLKEYPDTRVLFIEGLGMKLPRGKTDYDSVTKFLQSLVHLCKVHDLTIIGTVHTPKCKEGERYQLTRENILGSVAWGACCDAVLGFDFRDRADETKPGRIITFMPHSIGAPEIFHMAFQKEGDRLYLHQVAAPAEQEEQRDMKSLDALKAFMATLASPETDFRTSEVVTYFAGLREPLTPRTANRAIALGLQQNIIERSKKGQYRARKASILDAAMGIETK